MARRPLQPLIRGRGRFPCAAAEKVAVQLVSGIDDALLIRRRELVRAQGRRRLTVLLAVLGTLVALAGYKLIAMSSAFAVDSVRVTGAPPALERKIHAAVEQEARGRNLLSVDRGAIAGSLSDMPYVRSVSVDRAFPHTLAVTVRVEHPSMVVTVGKSDYLVSPDGRVLEMRSKAPAGLPAVSPARRHHAARGQHHRRRQRPRGAVGAVHTPAGFRGRVGRITKLTADSGTVSALVGTHITLRLGTPDDLALKLAVVQRVMRRITGAAAARPVLHRRVRAGPPRLRHAIDLTLKFSVRFHSIRFGLTPRVARGTLAIVPPVGRVDFGSPGGLNVFLGALSG